MQCKSGYPCICVTCQSFLQQPRHTVWTAHSLSVQDLHLAKRYYDRAAETAPSAKMPVQLALLSLALHSWYATVKSTTMHCCMAGVQGCFSAV